MMLFKGKRRQQFCENGQFCVIEHVRLSVSYQKGNSYHFMMHKHQYTLPKSAVTSD